jgi:N-acetylglucosamine-6-phosphate deacetylase
VTRLTLLRDLAVDGPTALLMEGEKIVATGAEALETRAEAEVMEAHGLRAVPGFVELQVNGVADHDFTIQPDAMWGVGPALARHGVTAFLPTVVSSPPGAVDAALRAFCDGGPSDGARPLGVHLEGPYLAPGRRGAHEAEHLRVPDLDEVGRWAASGALRILTLAPELPGALDAIATVVRVGAVAAIGHTDADAETAARAIDAGARAATHLFNAMAPLAHRAPGAVGALLADDRVTLGVIADGRHVDPLVLGLVARMAPERVALVSDATGPTLGDASLDASGGAARLEDGTLAGGAVALDGAVRTFATATGDVGLAIRAATEVPARLLGLTDRGRLAVGARADVVLLDDALTVRATLVGGDIAYDADGRWR